MVLGGGTGNSIRANAISDNVGLGIDLGGDGVTANDPQDVDMGPNTLQNFPEIASVTAGVETRVNGLFSGEQDVVYQLDFYAGSIADASNYGEGPRYLGSTQVTGIGSAQAFGASVGQAMNQELITATATPVGGGTSEFSQAAVATLLVPPAIVEGSLIITVVEENSEDAIYGTPTTLVEEGTTVRLDGTFTTPNTGQVVTIDWKDGTISNSLTDEVIVKGLGFTAEHSYADDFRYEGTTLPYEIRVTVTDIFGSIGVASRPLIVTNIPSQFAGQVSISPAVVNEGQMATLTGAYIDPGYGDDQILTIDWNDGSSIETVILPGTSTLPEDLLAPRPFTVEHAFRDNFNPNGEAIQVTVTLTDGDDGSETQTVSPIVFNTAPTPLITGPSSAPEGSRVTFNAVSNDSGAGDVLSYQWKLLRNGQDVTEKLTGLQAPSDTRLSFTPDDETTIEVRLIVRDDEARRVNQSSLECYQCCSGFTS